MSTSALVGASRQLAALIAGAQFCLMPGGHLAVLRSRADAYADRIDKFTAAHGR